MLKTSESRIVNSRRNIITGLIMQILNIVLPFVTRTAILYMLGIQYQGLGSLFNAILQVLNLADLGFSSAVVFVLYKPISEKDNPMICSIINFIRKAYFIIGSSIFVIGCVILPGLPYLISGTIPSDINIYLLFMIYLVNTSVSYVFFAYKNILFVAMQRKDIPNLVATLVNVVTRLIQIIVLFLTKNYYFFAICLPIGTVTNNIIVHLFSKKYYSHIMPLGTIDSETKKELKHQVVSIGIDRVCDVARNSFDNIIISIIMGLSVVAIFSNYFYIFTAVYGLMIVINQAITASVGNSIAKESVEKNYNDFRIITFIMMWINGVFSICMLGLYQNFMMIWMRNDSSLLFNDETMILFVIYFFIINACNSRNVYIDAIGIHPLCNKWCVLETIFNITFNFLFGWILGVIGILISTILTIILFNFIPRVNILFKNYFLKGQAKFYLSNFIYFIITALVGFLVYYLCYLIPMDGVLGLVSRAGICLIIPNCIFFLLFFKTKQFKNAFSMVLHSLKIK